MFEFDAIVIAVIVSLAVGVIQFIVVMIFWYSHIRYHVDNPIYRRRHPVFWQICLCIGSIQIISKALIIYLRINKHLSIELYQLIMPFITILMSFAFPFSRAFFLWYAVKLQRYKQNALIKRYLLTEEYMNNFQQNESEHSNQASRSMFDVQIPSLTEQTQIKPPIIFKYEPFFGRPSKIFTIFETILFIFCIIIGIISYLFSSHSTAETLEFIIIFILFSIMFCLGISLWCCTTTNYSNQFENDKDINNNKHNHNFVVHPGSKFKDNFNFQTELTLLLMTIIISISIEAFISIKYIGNGRNGDTDRSRYELLLLMIIGVITEFISFFIQTCIPYFTYKQNKESFDPSITEIGQTPTDVISLLHILRHKYGFYLFLDQLVQELSFENISVLIDIYQFKYVTRNLMNEYQHKHKFRTSTLIRSAKRQQIIKNKPSTLHLAKTAKLSNIESGKSTDFKKNGIQLTNRTKKWPSTVAELKVSTLENEEMVKERSDSLSASPIPPTTPNSPPTNSPPAAMQDLSQCRSASTDSEASESHFSSYLYKKRTADSDYFSQILSKLPWHGIPLTHCISAAKGFDKFIQAMNIYNKYIEKNSYYTINISSTARYNIESKMEQLRLWRERKSVNIIINDSNHNDNGGENDGMMEDIKEEKDESESESLTQTPPPTPEELLPNTDIESPESKISSMHHTQSTLSLHLRLTNDTEIITSESQFNMELMRLFDAVLPDIFHNLEDSMMRFRKTQAFRALTESDRY